jgi:hypothetical protein
MLTAILFSLALAHGGDDHSHDHDHDHSHDHSPSVPSSVRPMPAVTSSIPAARPTAATQPAAPSVPRTTAVTQPAAQGTNVLSSAEQITPVFFFLWAML